MGSLKTHEYIIIVTFFLYSALIVYGSNYSPEEPSGGSPFAYEGKPGTHRVYFEYTGAEILSDNVAFWKFKILIGSNWYQFSPKLTTHEVNEYYNEYGTSAFIDLGYDCDASKKTATSTWFRIMALYDIVLVIFPYYRTININIVNLKVDEVNKWIEDYIYSGNIIKHYYRYKVKNENPYGLVMEADSPSLPDINRLTWTFKASCTDPEKDSLYYLWFIDGRYQWGITSDTFTYTFPDYGEYNVTVKCEDYYGAFAVPFGLNLNVTKPIIAPYPGGGFDIPEGEEEQEEDSGIPNFPNEPNNETDVRPS